MSILSDWEIKERCHDHNPMIAPFHSKSVKENENNVKLLSYGSSSYGYDVTLASQAYIFTNINGAIIDPRNFTDDVYVNAKILKDDEGLEYFILPPNSYALGVTNEYFNMPRDVTAICLSKSTYARASMMVSATVIEAGWSGNVVLELANMCALPIKVYTNQGIAQFLFFKGEMCNVSYADRGGKYQFQTGITLPKV